VVQTKAENIFERRMKNLELSVFCHFIKMEKGKNQVNKTQG